MLLLRSQTTQPSSILAQAQIRSERGFLHNRILPIARRLARQRWLSKPQRRVGGIQRHPHCCENIRTLSSFSFRSGVRIQGVIRHYSDREDKVPLIHITLIENVFSQAQKQEMIQKFIAHFTTQAIGVRGSAHLRRSGIVADISSRNSRSPHTGPRATKAWGGNLRRFCAVNRVAATTA